MENLSNSLPPQSNGSSHKKFLFISHDGLIHDLAWQVKKEGNEVRYYIHSKADRDVADGFVEKTEDWESLKDWADVLVFDDIGYGPTVEKLRKEGKAVVGGPSYADKLELDRDFAQEEMKSVGMTTLPNWDFDSFDAAIDFVKQNPGRYVVKPNGKAQNEKILSFVGQEDDGHDIVAILEHYKKGWGSKIKRFQIQKFASGVEVAVGAFFNGEDFIRPVCVNFEHKRMFNDDIGPATGEMGTTMFFANDNAIFRNTLLKMKEKLAACGFVGYFDINCIANARGIYPLEFTPRFGYPTINIQMEGILSKWGEFLEALAKKQPFNLRTKKGFQIGVVVAVPPFPFSDREAFEKYSGDAAVIFKKAMSEGIHPGDIKLVNGEWLLAGSSGYALIVTGSGSTMDDTQKEAYNRIKNILIPNMFYRTDIGARWHRDGDLLQTWGYLQ